MISEEHLASLTADLTRYPITKGPWYTSPNGRGGGRIHTASGPTILEGPKHHDVIRAAAAVVFLEELLEEVTALRKLPGNHHQEAGLYRTLTRIDELRALAPGSLIEDEQKTQWRSRLDKKVIRWVNQTDPTQQRVTAELPGHRYILLQTA